MLKITDLKVHFPIRSGFFNKVTHVVKAVDGININVNQGECYGLVGESGCGKTTTGRAMLGLNNITSGSVVFEDEDITKTLKRSKSQFRKEMQMIFQDPYSSLNRSKTVFNIISEPLKNFGTSKGEALEQEVLDIMKIVGLSEDSLHKYPHQFSGGQRQRIGIARALALNPKFIVCDEPVSALDVSIQAQVLNFMRKIQVEFDLTYLFISHDLNIVKHMSDRIGVMHRGRLVEEGTVDDIFNNPVHIYTKKLISSIPTSHPDEREKVFNYRKEVAALLDDKDNMYYDEDGRPYDLKKISDTHYVSLKSTDKEVI